MDQYLDNGYLCPVNEAVQKKADAITADDKTDRAIAETLFHWVRDKYCWDMTKIRGAQYMLQAEPTYAMSFDKSNVLVSLLRSAGIPARFNYITCTFYNEYKDRIDDSVHAPVEVYLDGEWITADPAFGTQTEQFKSAAAFGEETWETIKSSKQLHALPRHFVFGYNYIFRFLHPDIRTIRSELRECQTV